MPDKVADSDAELVAVELADCETVLVSDIDTVEDTVEDSVDEGEVTSHP